MKIKMLKTRQGSPDGLVVNTYISGETVDVSNELAKVFIHHRWARKITVTNVKNRGKAPENKTNRKTSTAKK
jgi:hypothetical protein